MEKMVSDLQWPRVIIYSSNENVCNLNKGENIYENHQDSKQPRRAMRWNLVELIIVAPLMILHQ
jgi:hypothetical protein